MNVVAKKYKLSTILGKGQFGSVCKGECLKTGKNYAIKLESVHAPFSLLKHEATILFHLNSQGCRSIPCIYYYGIEDPYVCLVMTHYKGSLEDLRDTMDLDDKVIWWNTILRSLSKIHKSGIVHRDIKPQHFMFDNLGNWNLIDFGLATSYIQDSQHIERTQKDSVIGSTNYISLYVHEGYEPVRRDDFISLVYIFWELLYGTMLTELDSIPTDNTNDHTYEATHIKYPYNQWLYKQKQWDRLYLLLKEKNDILRDGMISILNHAENLDFSDKPSYDQFIIEIT